MVTERPGHKALEELDKVLAQQPHKDGHGLTAVTVCLTEFRDEIIKEQREDAGTKKERQRLAHLNSVISVVLGAHFPLGPVPWKEVKKARGWLADLVSHVE